jgi:uncharacterized delta-60 repeat protein
MRGSNPLIQLRGMRSFAPIGVLALLAACGGGDAPSPPPVNTSPLPATGIGAAGGTVTGTSGSKVVIPAGALATNVDVAISESSTGAPALPGALTTVGPTFAVTPHGTAFAAAVTVTIPFDASKVPAGVTPTLYKTNATQTAWEPVVGATVSGGTISGQVTGFSYFAAMILAFNDEYQFYDTTFAPWPEAPVHISKSAALDETHLPTHIDYVPPGVEKIAGGTVHIADYGKIYWVSAVAPLVNFADPKSPYGHWTTLKHTQLFRKTEAVASLELVVSKMTSELMDSHGQLPSQTECPALASGGTLADCKDVLYSRMIFEVHAWTDLSHGSSIDLAHGKINAGANGYIGHWFHSAGESDPNSSLKYSTAPQFAFNDDVDHFLGNHFKQELQTPIVIDIPLDAVLKDQTFYVEVTVIAQAENRRGGDAFAGTWFHDPEKTVGASYEGTGIRAEPILDAVAATRPEFPQVPAPVCTTGTDPLAGTIQLETSATRVPESVGGGAALIGVTRSGGTKGEVTALFTTSDGDGVAGVDYVAVTALVRFPDGDSTTRYVAVPVIDNHEVSNVRSLGVSLADMRGCAALGSPSAATIAILDDDAPPNLPTYTVGGTISGLEGTGLVLLETLGGARLTPAGNGLFTFPERLYSDAPYDVRVETQPGGPAQICTIANGSGHIEESDITNVAVTCAAIPSETALDPAFGASGKVTSSSFNPARAVALQADGKSVVLDVRNLTRYNSDGSLDTTFGIAGKVAIVASGGVLDAMEGLVIQSDGKIVVAGHTSTPPSVVQDFAVQRFNADGTLDTTFGSGGKVVTDFSGTDDMGYAIALQGDGMILVAGTTVVGTGANADQDFAVVRYKADGNPDPAFGSGGKTNIDVAGTADFGYAIAWQFDGRVVVAGRVAADGGTDPDFGFARLEANGQPDLSFGVRGRAQVAFVANAWDEAHDMLVQPDGKIVAGGYARIGTVFQYAAMRLDSDGSVDTKFGAGGKAATSLAVAENFGRALARDADGNILIAGQVSTLTNGDFGILRLTSTGLVDTSFGNAGLLTVDFFGGTDNVQDMLVQPDGKILVVGSAVNRFPGLAMVRITP